MAAAYNYRIEIISLSEEDGCGFLAIAPDLRGCMADGWTQREALANLHDAIAEWIEDARAVDRPVPEPKYCVFPTPGCLSSFHQTRSG
jgi:antitoxin HicB